MIKGFFCKKKWPWLAFYSWKIHDFTINFWVCFSVVKMGRPPMNVFLLDWLDKNHNGSFFRFTKDDNCRYHHNFWKRVIFPYDDANLKQPGSLFMDHQTFYSTASKFFVTRCTLILLSFWTLFGLTLFTF